MAPLLRKFGLAAIGFGGALVASLASMKGGDALTIAQVGSIPLVAWIGAGVAGATGFLEEKNLTKKVN